MSKKNQNILKASAYLVDVMALCLDFGEGMQKIPNTANISEMDAINFVRHTREMKRHAQGLVDLKNKLKGES